MTESELPKPQIMIPGARARVRFEGGPAQIVTQSAAAHGYNRSVYLFFDNGRAIHVPVLADLEKIGPQSRASKETAKEGEEPKDSPSKQTILYLAHARSFQADEPKPLGNAQLAAELTESEKANVIPLLEQIRQAVGWNPFRGIVVEKRQQEQSVTRQKERRFNPPIHKTRPQTIAAPRQKERRTSPTKNKEPRVKKLRSPFDHLPDFKEEYAKGAHGWTEEKIAHYAGQIAATPWYLDRVKAKLKEKGVENPDEHHEKIVEIGTQAFINVLRKPPAPGKFSSVAGTYLNSTVPKIFNALNGIRPGRRKRQG